MESKDDDIPQSDLQSDKYREILDEITSNTTDQTSTMTSSVNDTRIETNDFENILSPSYHHKIQMQVKDSGTLFYFPNLTSFIIFNNLHHFLLDLQKKHF